MKVDLIALCTEETKQNTFNTICPLVQQKLNASSVEVLSTTVFCDLYAISKNLSRHLNTPTVLVGDFDNNIDLGLLKSIISQKFSQPLQPCDFGFFVQNQNSSCLIINTGKFNFFDYLVPENVCKLYNIASPIAYLKVFGLDKISIIEKLEHISNMHGFYYTVYVSYMEGEICVSNPNNMPNFECQKMVRELYEQFNNYYFADNDKPMLQILDEILTVRNIKICAADILTQGVFENFLKEGLPNFEQHIEEIDTLSTLEDVANTLQVGTDFLATHKKDSVELCYEMGVSMVEHLSGVVALVLSGTYKIPFIGVGDEQAIHVYKYNFDHSSEYITQIICRQAVFKIIKKLSQN